MRLSKQRLNAAPVAADSLPAEETVDSPQKPGKRHDAKADAEARCLGRVRLRSINGGKRRRHVGPGR